MSCNKRGLVSIGHNKIRDLTANMLRDVSNDAEVEVKLMPLTGEQLQYRSAITGVEARLDIRARSFWVRGQEAFLDIRVFDPNANKNLNATLPRCHKINEKEKKRNYNNRILQIEHGILRGVWEESVQNFIQNLKNCYLINVKKVNC